MGLSRVRRLAFVTAFPLLTGCIGGARRAHVSAGEAAIRPVPATVPSVDRRVRTHDIAPASHLALTQPVAKALASRRLPRLPVVGGQPLQVSISLANRMLSLTRGRDTIFYAPVAVAEGLTLAFAGRQWRFQTPRGERTVRRKVRNPIWTPPDWHYAEAALRHGLRLERLPVNGTAVSGGRRIVIRNRVVGVVYPDNRFLPLPTNEHIVFDRRLFIPPMGTLNRRLANELGGYALDLGDGYLIHGGNDGLTIDKATTHGCIRLDEAELRWLFDAVPLGATVLIH
jgi:hypothetical protein